MRSIGWKLYPKVYPDGTETVDTDSSLYDLAGVREVHKLV